MPTPYPRACFERALSLAEGFNTLVDRVARIRKKLNLPEATVIEAIERANALPYAFQAAGFTSRLDTAMQLVNALDATAVMINDHTAFRVDWMPFAGRGLSGYGTGGIGYTMHDMTEDKMAVIRL